MTRAPRIVFANTVSELMLSVPVHAHSRSLAAVSHRKIWLAHEGDVVVTPRPIPDALRRYACALLGVSESSLTYLSADAAVTEPLAQAIARNGLRARLAGLVADCPELELFAFAQDERTLRLAADIGIRISGYRDAPDADLRHAIAALNTKSGFRRVAAELGFPVVAGGTCEGVTSLAADLAAIVDVDEGVIVKLDRSSNGYGHVFLSAAALAPPGLRDRLEGALAAFSEQPRVFTYERWIEFDSVPSVEMVVDDDGPSLLYLCDQRCPGASFSGLVTPPENLDPRLERRLLDIGLEFGHYLHRIGYRGVFDVDGGITPDGALYVTETNLRRTGGTYLDSLIRRLVGEEYAHSHVWIADARIGRTDIPFVSAIREVEQAGLAFDDRDRVGVVLTADTVAIDGKWRYVVIARSLDEGDELEHRLETVLGLH